MYFHEKKTHLKSVYVLTHGLLGLGSHICASVERTGMKIKSGLSVPVGRRAALRKQAFMCSGRQAFDVSSRV